MAKLDAKTVGLLKGKNFAFIATINPDGSPQVTPVWADTDGSRILINTAVGRVKEKNAARDPRVAISLIDSASPYTKISVDGRVTETISGKKADDHIDFLSFKYTGNKKFQGRSPKEKRIILVVEPTRIRET